MKIVCEACQAKYSISDDKVRGKAFKIRCKKCSHIIVVRATGAMDAVAEPAAAPPPAAAPAPSAAAAAWHIVVEGEQVGPLPDSDIRARLSRGEITGETYIWKEGLADWQKISAVPEFADAVGGSDGGYDDGQAPFAQQAPTTVYPPGTSEAAFAAPANAEPDVFAAPTVVS